MKNYVKKHKGHDVPDGAAYYNDKSRCFFNKDKTKYSPLTLNGQWFTVSVNSRFSSEAIELPENDEVFEIIHAEQDLPNWDDAPSDAAVWIVDNDNEFPSGFYGLAANGYHYQSYATANTYNIRCVDDESITVHKRPIAREIDWSSAPEWADRLLGIKSFRYWANVERFAEVGFFSFCTESTKFSIGETTIGDLELIEMRPIAIEVKEWLPAVGETIRISFEDVDHAWITRQEMNIDGNDVTLLGITISSKGQRIYTFEDEDGYCDCYPHDCFIPIKSMDEAYKEEFISWAKGGLSYSLEERAFAYRIIKELADNLKSMPNKGEG